MHTGGHQEGPQAPHALRWAMQIYSHCLFLSWQISLSAFVTDSSTSWSPCTRKMRATTSSVRSRSYMWRKCMKMRVIRSPETSILWNCWPETLRRITTQTSSRALAFLPVGPAPHWSTPVPPWAHPTACSSHFHGRLHHMLLRNLWPPRQPSTLPRMNGPARGNQGAGHWRGFADLSSLFLQS